MPQTNENAPSKEPMGMLSFRTGNSVKNFLSVLAENNNLDASDISRAALYNGLETLYGVKVVGNQIVKRDSE